MSRSRERCAAFLFMDAVSGVIRAVTQFCVIAEQFDRSGIARASIVVETLLVIAAPLAAGLMFRGRPVGWRLGIAVLLLVMASMNLQVEWETHREAVLAARDPMVPRPVNNEIGVETLVFLCRIAWNSCYFGVLLTIRRAPLAAVRAAGLVGRTSPG